MCVNYTTTVLLPQSVCETSYPVICQLLKDQHCRTITPHRKKKLSIRYKVLNNFTRKLRKLSPNRIVSLQLEGRWLELQRT